MSFASQFHMPGAYNFDAPTTGPTLSASLFRPPVSPSASSSVLNLAKSTGSLISEPSTSTTAPHIRRKRTRDDAARESTPAADWTTMSVDGAYEPTSPYDYGERVGTPLENGSRQIRYTLAGQIETPNANPVTANPLEANLEDSVYSDIDYRRAMGPKRPHDDLESPSIRRVGFDSNRHTPADRDGWNVFTTIGGVVGKVLDFCTAGAFKGFYAGGGRGYDIKPGSPPTGLGPESGPWLNKQDLSTLQTRDALASNNALSGEYHLDRGIPKGYGRARPETLRRPSAKRRQVSEIGDELGRNWVMVPEPEVQSQRRKRPSVAATTIGAVGPGSRQQQRPIIANRRISTPVSRLGGTPNLTRRTSSRISHAGSPSLNAREPASFAPPRSPMSPSRPSLVSSSRIPVPSQASNPFARAASPRPSSRHSAISSPVNTAFPDATSHGRTHSGASAASTTRRKTGLGADDIEASPRLDAEAKHLATRKLAAERDTYARIDAFDARLREMIRQGREALGTTIDVEGDGEGIWEDD